MHPIHKMNMCYNTDKQKELSNYIKSIQVNLQQLDLIHDLKECKVAARLIGQQRNWVLKCYLCSF